MHKLRQKIKVVIVDKINLDSIYLFNKNKFDVVTDLGITNEEILIKKLPPIKNKVNSLIIILMQCLEWCIETT